MNFEQEFNATFGEKYNNLHLKEVMVKRREGSCTITFLCPSTEKEITDDEKREIKQWFENTLQFEKMSIRVKFKKAFVEERLILKALQNFFAKKYTIVTTYLSNDNFKINITPIDVGVDITVSERMHEFFVEHKIVAELAKYLKDNFLMEFVVNLKQDFDFVDEVDLENVEIKTKYKPAQRYSVEIVKEVIGKGIPPKPEYLSFITAPKSSVIVAGYIKNIERKEFVRKTGKRAGQTGTFFSFQIVDGKGKMDCVYFSSKVNVAVMESLEECMYVLLHGDVKLNYQNKLCLQVDKIALAGEIFKDEDLVEQKDNREFSGQVVPIERLTALEQDSMFGQSKKYNEKISGNTIVVFDIETTGLDPQNDQIIELGAVKIEKGNIIEKFSTFVKPTKKLSYEVIELTGITEEMLEDAPPIDLVIKEFYEFSKGCTLSGHNVIGFDIKFVKREGENVGLEFDNELIDTMKEAMVSRKLKISRFNLGAVTKALGITLEGAHRAWNDAFATAQVLLKLNEA